jgi:hypothetical protein
VLRPRVARRCEVRERRRRTWRGHEALRIRAACHSAIFWRSSASHSHLPVAMSAANAAIIWSWEL